MKIAIIGEIHPDGLNFLKSHDLEIFKSSIKRKAFSIFLKPFSDASNASLDMSSWLL